MRLIVYFGLGLAQTLLHVIADFIFVEMLVRSARSLHNSLLFSMLRSKMMFFEQTPVLTIFFKNNKKFNFLYNS
jgi:hypothetical protein